MRFCGQCAAPLGAACPACGAARILLLVSAATGARTRSGSPSWGKVYLRAGRGQEALPCARRALALAEEVGARPAQAWTLRLIGEIGSRSEPPDAEEAGRAYAQAMTLAEPLGMRPLVAHCHLGLGKLYLRAGRHAAAGEHLATAAALYREMGMRFWLNEVEAAAAQPAN